MNLPLAFALAVAAAVLALAAPVPADGRILYVGDSLGVGTVPSLRAETALDGDTEIGRTSSEGLAILRSELRPRHRIVIFDLGTNDAAPATLARDLRRARALARERLIVVFTVNKPGAAPFNAAVRAFARSTAGVAMIHWHATATREGLLAGDGIHASAAGYRRRAELVLRRLRARAASASCRRGSEATRAPTYPRRAG